MNIMEQLLKNKIYNFFKYKILSEKDENKLFSQLAMSNYLQAKNIFKNLSNIEMGKIHNDIEERLKNFYNKNLEKFDDKEKEKLFVYSKEITRMEYMLIDNYVENKELKNLYVCKNCGWIGSDEPVKKCPLCTNEDIIKV